MLGHLLQVEVEERNERRDWVGLRKFIGELPDPGLAEVIADLPPED